MNLLSRSAMNENKTRSRLSVKDLTLFSMLGGIMFVAKMSMAALPNIEPVSFLVIIYTAFWGKRTLYPIYLYVFLECAIWGIGLWTISYLYIWTILWAAAYLLRWMKSSLVWAVVSGVFGLMFGALCAPVYVLSGGWAFALSWWLSGLYYDLLHCAGNFVLTLMLYKPCCFILEKALKKELRD